MLVPACAVAAGPVFHPLARMPEKFEKAEPSATVDPVGNGEPDEFAPAFIVIWLFEFVALRSCTETVVIVVPLSTVLWVLLSWTPLLVAVALAVPLAMPKLPAFPTPVEVPLLVIVPLLVDCALADIDSPEPAKISIKAENETAFLIFCSDN